MPPQPTDSEGQAIHGVGRRGIADSYCVSRLGFGYDSSSFLV
jgi:hypothetical protein